MSEKIHFPHTVKVLDFEFGRKKLIVKLILRWRLKLWKVLIQFFREESIGEGFKIVTVAVFEKILLFEKKNWFVFDRNF